MNIAWALITIACLGVFAMGDSPAPKTKLVKRPVPEAVEAVPLQGKWRVITAKNNGGDVHESQKPEGPHVFFCLGALLKKRLDPFSLPRDIIRWGTGAGGAQARQKTITLQELTQAEVTNAQAQAARNFYAGVLAKNPGNAAAAARVKLMDHILSLLGGS